MRTSDLGKLGFRHVFIIEFSQDVKGEGGRKKEKGNSFGVDGGNSKSNPYFFRTILQLRDVLSGRG